MDQPLFDIYFTGQLVDGISTEQAQAGLAKLFKTSEDKAANYFTGKPVPLKRGVDKATALKYKAALHKVGMMVAFKSHQEKSPQESAPQTATQASEAAAHPANAPSTPTASTPGTATDFDLAPVGADVLTEQERHPFVEANIDTSNIKLASAFIDLEPEPQATPPAPDTSHISVAAAGEDLQPDRPEPAAPPELNLDDMTLAPPGTELEELHDDQPPLNPDTSAISMAPVGSDVFEQRQEKPTPPPPKTDHLTLED